MKALVRDWWFEIAEQAKQMHREVQLRRIDFSFGQIRESNIAECGAGNKQTGMESY
jgi:hypothetical protein